MRKIDSDALTLVQRQLGLSGIAEPGTMLLGDELVQSLDVSSAVRRSRADIASGGIFNILLQNDHGGADSEVSSVDLYEAAANALNTYPRAVSNRFDVWLLAVSAQRITGAGLTTAAVWEWLFPQRFMGVGRDDGGSTVAAKAVDFPIAFFDEMTAVPSGNVYARNSLTLEVSVYPKTRVPRGALLQFSTTSSGIMLVDGNALIGVFPLGMGQDIVL